MPVARLWRSATWMTWAALSMRISGFAMIVPLVLARFIEEDTSIWLLFSAIATLQLIADMGFSQTFARTIAYSYAGGSIKQLQIGSAPVSDDVKPAKEANTESLALILSTMAWIYRRLAVIALIVLLLFGSLAVMKPINASSNPEAAWIAWLSVIVGVSVFVYGNSYTAYLIGSDRIHVLKRWELVVNTFSVLTQILILILDYGLLPLVLTAQLWVLIQVLVNRNLAVWYVGNTPHLDGKLEHDKKLLRAMWASAWRSALGVLMSLGVSQGMFVLMANILPAKESSSVLLGLRVVQTVSQFSQAPFYSRIPSMNACRIRGQVRQLADLASLSMRKSLWVFTLGSISIGYLLPVLMDLLGSATQFPDKMFWAVLVVAYFMERYGGMHIQLYSTTNHIVWHIANGVSGLIWIITLAIIYPWLNALALPISMLISYSIFYSWYAAKKSHQALPNVGVVDFEKKTTLVPVVVIIAYAFIMCISA